MRRPRFVSAPRVRAADTSVERKRWSAQKRRQFRPESFQSALKCTGHPPASDLELIVDEMGLRIFGVTVGPGGVANLRPSLWRRG
jgi:hypothetical protein